MADIARINDKQKALQGSSRYVKNTPPAKPIQKIWPCPRDLGDTAKKFYSSIGKELAAAGVLTEMDKPAFLELCQLYEQVCALRGLLRADGYVVTDDNGKVSRHPASVLYRDTLASFIGLSAKFGLNPFDRKKIDLPVDKNSKDASREFLGL